MSAPRFLCPVDFSEPSRVALQQADWLAQLQGACITLLHVHPVMEAALVDFNYTQPPAQLEELRHALSQRLNSWAHELTTPAPQVQCEVVMGAPVGDIVARSHGFDLIIMGTHGRSGISHFLLGSVAERVVRDSHCSVLIAKPPKRTS